MTTETNNNHVPDNAFEQTQPTSTQPSAFDMLYDKATQEEKFQYHKEQVYKKHGVDTSAPAPTIADQLAAQANSKIEVHQDGSVTTKKGALGNDKASAELIRILREQAYQRHNITE